MKTKKVLDKKLVLNKGTVANLNATELKEIYGGVSLTVCRTECATRCIACHTRRC
jgi:hypothetical protein